METKIFKLNTPRSRVIRGFLVAYGKKSLGEIFNKNMAYGQKLFNYL